MGYLFDPAVLKECAAQGIDLPLQEAFDAVTAALAKRYPGHIHTGPREWIFNNAGGAKGVLTLLHGSVLEYLILFGSDIGTHGHSGIYRADVYDWVFAGEMWCQEGQHTERRVYRPGSQAHLGRGQVKYYRLPERGWMLEYARVPSSPCSPSGWATRSPPPWTSPPSARPSGTTASSASRSWPGARSERPRIAGQPGTGEASDR